MQGFLNGAPDALQCGDNTLSGTEKSEFFQAGLNNPPQATRVMDEDVFRDFLDYSVLVARKAAKEIKDGYIAPTPYEKSCEYCKYGGMCGFKKDSAKQRKEPTIEPKRIAAIAREARDGKED